MITFSGYVQALGAFFYKAWKRGQSVEWRNEQKSVKEFLFFVSSCNKIVSFFGWEIELFKRESKLLNKQKTLLVFLPPGTTGLDPKGDEATAVDAAPPLRGLLNGGVMAWYGPSLWTCVPLPYDESLFAAILPLNKKKLQNYLNSTFELILLTWMRNRLVSVGREQTQREERECVECGID